MCGRDRRGVECGDGVAQSLTTVLQFLGGCRIDELASHAIAQLLGGGAAERDQQHLVQGRHASAM